jgi:transcriptional regulatory protein RtcR
VSGHRWHTHEHAALVARDLEVLDVLLGAQRADALDRFDRVQLADVVSVCASQPSLSAAGRILFARSREAKTTRNDAHRLRTYLQRFGLTFEQIRR